MRDLMIDLETLGTDPNCPVLSIGACLFATDAGQIGDTFYAVLDIDEQISRGRRPSGSTIKWWMSQGDAARSAFAAKGADVRSVLEDFAKWYNGSGFNPDVWGNGAHFDISILEDLYRDYGIPVPWGHYKVQDLRTFKRFVGCGDPIPKLGTAHNALDDALSQAQYVLDHV